MQIPHWWVAVYKWYDLAYFTAPVQIPSKTIPMFYVKDIIVTNMNLPIESKFILATIYVQQWVPYNDLAMFLSN